MATKRTNKIDANTITAATKKVNNFLVDTTEMIVDETIDKTGQWQNLADKAIKGGFKLTKKQADLTFKALETVKKQWRQGQSNFIARVK